MNKKDTKTVKMLLKWYSDGMGAHAAEYQAWVREFIERIYPGMIFSLKEGSAIEEAIQCSCCEPEFQFIATNGFLDRFEATHWWNV